VDVTVLAVACNNFVSLRTGKKTLFDSLKRINLASKESLEHKLTRKQTLEIGINKCMLLLQGKKNDEVARELERLRETHRGHPRVAIVEAAIADQEKKPEVCEETLQKYLAEHPGQEDVLLCLAQFYAKKGRMEKALQTLVQLPVRRRAQPKIIEAIAALHIKQRNLDKAIASIRDGVGYWASDEAGADEETLAKVLRIALRFSKQLKNSELSAEINKLYLEKVDGSDVGALCALVQGLTTTDIERAEQYAQRLRVPSYEHLDPEALEIAEIPKMRGAVAKREEVVGADGAVVPAKKKRCRRKIRYPKGFDPANPGPPPDPERWLPKRERTEYKKKMRKRDKHLQRGPQGAMPTDDQAFRKQGPSTAQVEASKDNSIRRNQGRRKQGKK
jgi:signal recognition particle subunit SRP72